MRTGIDIMRDLTRFGLQAFYWDQDEFGSHTHDFVEFVYVLRGRADHIFMDRRYPIMPGDCFVINTDESHGYAAVDNLRIVNILVTREFLVRFLPLLRTMKGFTALFSLEPLFRDETSFRYKLHLSAGVRAKVEPAIDALARESEEQTDGFQVAGAAMLLEIIAMACRAFTAREAASRDHDFRGKEDAVSRAVAFLESKYDHDISPDQVAEFVCLSPSRLRHLFKETTGTSLMDYLLRCRLERARETIRTEDRPLSQVAYAVGFHDPAYFSRAYRRHFGHSPRHEAADRPPVYSLKKAA